MQPDLLEIKPSHIQPLWSLRTSWKAGGSLFLPDFYTFNTTARKGFTGDGLTQASIHLLCKFSRTHPWTYLCNPCLLQWPAWLRALQCSGEEMGCNSAVWATKLTVAMEGPWAISSAMSQRCGSHAQSVPLGIFAALWASCLADRQQPGMIIGDHNLSKQIPMAFISGCCAFSIIRSQRKSDVIASAFRAGKGTEHRRVFRNLEWEGWCLVFR